MKNVFSQDNKWKIVWGVGELRDAFSKHHEKQIFLKRSQRRSISNMCGEALNPTYPAICQGLNIVFQVVKII